MNRNYDVEHALAALDSYGLNKKNTSSLSNARNKEQVISYLRDQDFSLRRMLILQESINQLIDEKKQYIIKQENVQTFKTKIINLSRQYNIKYDDVLEVMQDQTRHK
ncbi:hypothetical protein [Shewanella waksmanii]|uniref:hypothetical protein n=1 Tax=Shewanella waksmanii TaxID=213783 RepID=UPI003736725B